MLRSCCVSNASSHHHVETVAAHAAQAWMPQKQHSLASECRRDYNKRVKEVVEKSWIDGGGADDDDDTK